MLKRICDICGNDAIGVYSIVGVRKETLFFKYELCTGCVGKIEEFISDLKIAESESTGGIKNMHWGKKDDEDSSFDLDND